MLSAWLPAPKGFARPVLPTTAWKIGAQEIALRALEGAWACKPQHLICEIGSCGLPLDPSNEGSRAQTEQQYENAVQALNDASAELDLGMYDAILLNGLRSVADAECAINAVRRKTDRPVFASVDLDEDGLFAGKDVEDIVSALESSRRGRAFLRGRSGDDCRSRAPFRSAYGKATAGADSREGRDRYGEETRNPGRLYSWQPLCNARFSGRCGLGSARGGCSVPACRGRSDAGMHGCACCCRERSGLPSLV